MCRFLVYKGREILLGDLLTRPKHSLIKQSYEAEELSQPLNGDGFGVGWYVPEIELAPCLFTSVTPAWSNQNLLRLAEKITSGCIFAHIRAASPGLLVTDVNCHPFHFGRFLWMHNGAINAFQKIKRTLRLSLRDDIYLAIQGTTDSEHAFAVFLNQLQEGRSDYSAEEIKIAVLQTIAQLNAWSRDAGIHEPSYYNFAVTDGENVIATRYVSDPERRPASLYYSHGAKFVCQDGVCHMLPEAAKHDHAIIISSEPLTRTLAEWQKVPRNHIVIGTADLGLKIEAIEIK